MECDVCKKDGKKGFLHKEGCICKECLNLLPVVMKKELRKRSFEDIESNILYFSKFREVQNEFKPTLEMRNLAVDEISGLIRIGPKRENNIFDITNLETEQFTIEPIDRKNQDIIVDIYFSFSTKEPKFRSEKIKLLRTSVPLFEDSDGELTVNLPYKVQIFENAIIACNHKLIEKWNWEIEHGKKVNDRELERAKGLFLIGDNEYTLEYIKKYRTKMLKIFHPDNNPDIQMDAMIEKINEAYYILKREIEE